MRVLGWLAVACLMLGACGQAAPPGAAPPTELTIIEPADGAIVDLSAIVVRGTAPAGARVVREVPFQRDTEATADGSGNWFMVADLSTGQNELTFRVGEDRTTEQTIIVTLRPAGGATP